MQDLTELLRSCNQAATKLDPFRTPCASPATRSPIRESTKLNGGGTKHTVPRMGRPSASLSMFLHEKGRARAGNIGEVKEKKKKLYDGRTREARAFMKRMEMLRAKRESKLQKKVQENTENFGQEYLLAEDNVAVLKNIVKNKNSLIF